MMKKNSRVAELLGVEYPVLSAAMSWVTSAELTAAVSEAGGFGLLGSNAGQSTLSTDPQTTATRMRAEIRKTMELTKKPYGGQVAILGKRGHAEVVGLTGQIEEPIAVIEGVEDLEALDYQRPIYLLSQTTQSVALFNNIAAMIRRRLPDEDMLVAEDTICRRVANREKLLKEFAARHDVIIFVCGKKSSNGKVLYEVCRAVNEHSYNIEEAAELRREWFEECRSVGICGATSTPLWLMEDVARRIEEEFSV